MQAINSHHTEPSLFSRDEQYARQRRRDHANIEAMQNLIIRGIVDLTGIPFPPKLRAFISALQSAHGGGWHTHKPFERSHLAVAQYMQFTGTKMAREARVRRLIQSLEDYHQQAGILLFQIKRGGEFCIAEDGTESYTATQYTDLLKPIADTAVMRARASEYWAKHPGLAMTEQLEWALSELVKFDPVSEELLKPGEMELREYAETQRGRLEKSANKVADKIQARGGKGAIWLRTLAKRLLQQAEMMDRPQPTEPVGRVTNLLPCNTENTNETEGKLSKVEAAFIYAGRGLCAFPCEQTGKRPLIKEWQNQATTDPAMIRQWWGKWPHANIGIATGAASNLIVLDVDFEKGGDASLCKLIEEYGDIETAHVQTGAGLHFYFQHPGIEIRNNAGRLGEGLDVRGDGGYVIAPPSIHPNGACYEWLKASPIASMPKWLCKRLKEEKQVLAAVPTIIKSHSQAKGSAAAGALIPEGERNETLFRIGCAMRGQGESCEEIEAYLLELNTVRCVSPLPEGEIRRIATSAAKYPSNSAKAISAGGTL